MPHAIVNKENFKYENNSREFADKMVTAQKEHVSSITARSHDAFRFQYTLEDLNQTDAVNVLKELKTIIPEITNEGKGVIGSKAYINISSDQTKDTWELHVECSSSNQDDTGLVRSILEKVGEEAKRIVALKDAARTKTTPIGYENVAVLEALVPSAREHFATPEEIQKSIPKATGMYNLPLSAIKSRLNFLVRKGLVEHSDDATKFRLTQEGIEDCNKMKANPSE